jgi:putative transposase
MYQWRKMTDEERERVMKLRRSRRFPMHSPPHLDLEGNNQYIITAACYEHAHVIGKNVERMTACETDVLQICRNFSSAVYAWSILPNHYHVLLATDRIKDLRDGLGQYHGRSSFSWNGEDDQRGRKVWHNCFERPMKSERHFWASLNYVHHNPIHHGYAEAWQDWPWSSAKEFLEQTGREKVLEIWTRYPILEYGKKWDVY